MSNVRRIYVEKKEPYAVKAKELHDELKNYLGIDVAKVREFIRYDVENISDEVFARACKTVFSEPPVDDLYEETIDSCGCKSIFRRVPSRTVRSESGFRSAVCEVLKRGRRTCDPYRCDLYDRRTGVRRRIFQDQILLYQPCRFQRDRHGEAGYSDHGV